MTTILDDKHDVVHVENTAETHVVDNDKQGAAEDFITDNSGFHSTFNELSFWQTIKIFKVATFCCFAGSFGALSDNYQLSVPGNVLALPGFIKTMGVPDATASGGYSIPTARVSAWSGILTGAQILVLIICAWYPPHDRFGRKPVLFAVQAFMIIACITEMFAKSWGIWALAKAFNGISVSLNQQVACVYLSEIAPTNIRGAMLALYSVWWGIGGFACAIASECVSLLPDSKWRHIIYSEWVFSGIAVACIFVVPETPRWYAARDDHEAAKRQLRILYGRVEGYDIEREYGIIRKEIEDGRVLEAMQSKSTYLSLFTGTNLRRTLISTIPFSWQLWLGVPVIFGYTSYFFQKAGLEKPFLATVAINAVYNIALVSSFFLTELVGRRPLLLVNGVIMVICLAGVSILDKFIDRGASYGTGLIALSCLWMAAYSISAGPLGYVYLAEISTLTLRAKTISMALFFTQCQNFFGTYAVPYMLNGKGFGIVGTAAFFAGAGAIGWVIVYLFVPETKGRSYVELDELFEGRVPVRKFKQTVTSIDLAKRENGRV